MLRFLVFLLFVAVAAGAFYGGMKYQTARSNAVQSTSASNADSAKLDAERAALFERKRAAVDSDPQKWINDNVPLEMARSGVARAIDSKDPEFLYLYGRALMVSGNHREALEAFDRAINTLPTETKAKLPLDVEVRLASARAAMKLKAKTPSQETLMAEQKALRALDDLLNLKSEAQ